MVCLLRYAGWRPINYILCTYVVPAFASGAKWSVLLGCDKTGKSGRWCNRFTKAPHDEFVGLGHAFVESWNGAVLDTACTVVEEQDPRLAGVEQKQ